MKRTKEISLLLSIRNSIENTEKSTKGMSALISLINIVIFVVIGYTYMDVKRGGFDPGAAIIICVILAVLSGVLSYSKYTITYKRYSAKYINKENVEERLNEIST